MDKKPLIVIGAPVYGSVAPEILEDWMAFAFHCGRRLPQYDFQLAIRTKAEQFRARNTIVDAAVEANAQYLLMIDDDMIINTEQLYGESNGYGFLETLLGHDKDICGVLYYQRTGECQPVLMSKMGTGGYRFLRENEIEHKLQRVDVAGGGLLLVNMKVFDKVIPPYFEPEFKFGTDIQLCRKAAEKGFEVWADTSIEFGHVRDERVIVTSKNRHQFAVNVSGEGRKFLATHVYDEVIRDAEEWTGFPQDQFKYVGTRFMQLWKDPEYANLEDAQWYTLFPKERVARQVWFNTENDHKRKMTEYMLSIVRNDAAKDILDFGCGIGIPAFAFAQQKHRVTAKDLPNTGTYQFLQWRAKKHKVDINFEPAAVSGVSKLEKDYDVIVAMDCLEHLPHWREQLKEFADHLRPGGILFANNAILDDPNHPEHYDLTPKMFVPACTEVGLMPVSQFAYTRTYS